ncbi:MAG: HD domain-containing protein [Pseudomonadota bacterium]
MNRIADFLFEGHMLKNLPRSGYPFLGVGKESVAEHTFMVAFIAWVLSRMEPTVDVGRLISMCLVHDLPEARIGDLNAVQKRYVRADEDAAVTDTAQGLPFGDELTALIGEFNAGLTRESQLARDADHLALVIDLKALSDRGYRTPEKWQPHVLARLKTESAKSLARAVTQRDFDGWWLDGF